VALRALHGAEHVRGRRRWWTGLRRFRYEHQLYRGGRTALGQPHAQKKTVPGQARVTARTQTGSSNGNG
jgi:hypothetical protein